MSQTDTKSTEGLGYSKRHTRASALDGTVLNGVRFDLQHPSSWRRSRLPQNKTPLLCIPSELGTIAEYQNLVNAMAPHPGAPKTIFMYDQRGRGTSSEGAIKDSNTLTDANDLISFCDAHGLHHCDVLVTGRSSFSMFLTGPNRPSLFRRLVLNEAAPEFDAVGIARMGMAERRANLPPTWQEAEAQVKRLKQDEFTGISDEDWYFLTHTKWQDKDGKPGVTHEPTLSRLSNSENFDSRQPEVWAEFRLFNNCPTLWIEGENSSLLSEQISTKLTRQQNRVSTIKVAGQGHAPLLHTGKLPETICDFLGAEVS